MEANAQTVIGRIGNTKVQIKFFTLSLGVIG